MIPGLATDEEIDELKRITLISGDKYQSDDDISGSISTEGNGVGVWVR